MLESMSAGEFQGESNTWTKLLHTETIDAAWIALKKILPHSLSLQHRDLLQYAKAWQWRCT